MVYRYTHIQSHDIYNATSATKQYTYGLSNDVEFLFKIMQYTKIFIIIKNTVTLKIPSSFDLMVVYDYPIRRKSTTKYILQLKHNHRLMIYQYMSSEFGLYIFRAKGNQILYAPCYYISMFLHIIAVNMPGRLSNGKAVNTVF